MNFANISAWSIRNPVVPIVLFIALTLAGIVSFMGMEVQDDPDIEFPVVVVVISQPGAAPSEIVSQISQKVETAVRNINGVQQIDTTANEGSSEVVIQFEIGDDISEAVNEVKNAVDQIRSDLPDGILEPQIFKAQTSGNPIGYFAVETTDMTLEQLSWFVDDTIAKRLLAVPGMSTVSRSGGVDREIRVTLNTEKMQSLGVTASQINGAIRQVNFDAAGGKAEIAGSRQSIRVLGNTGSAYELSQSQISLGAGRTIKLSDVADVTDGFGEQRSITRQNDRQVVTFSITRAKGASDVSVFDAAAIEMDKIQKENPALKFVPLTNSVTYTRAQYASSMAAMIEGALLAIVVVFLFLRDWRATIISSIAIPLSAIPAFWFIDLLGFTLNQMSLLALGLVAGVLVDDAIVEIENIVRHMRMGKSAYQASIDAADEIGLAVVATTFSIVAVFLPVGLMPGVAGEYFKNFGLTVVAAVLMSLAVARMITPMIAAYFMKSGPMMEHKDAPWLSTYMRMLHFSIDNDRAKAMRGKLRNIKSRFAYYAPAFLFGLAALLYGLVATDHGEAGLTIGTVAALFFTNFIGGFILGWIATILAGLLIGIKKEFRNDDLSGWAMFIVKRIYARLFDHRIWMMLLGVVALAITGVFGAILPKQLFPDANRDSTRISIQATPGTTLERTSIISAEIAALLRKQPESNVILERVEEGSSSITVTFHEERSRTSQDFEKDLTPLFQKYPDVRINFRQQGPGGDDGGTGRAITVMLSGSDPAVIEKAAATLVEQMKTLPDLQSPRIAANLNRPELIIRPRKELAAQLGITTSALSQTIRIATQGDIDQNSAKFSLSSRQIPIRVVLPADSRQSMTTIANLPVQIASGGSVPLSRVADIRFGSGPTSIQRTNQKARVFVGADLSPGVAKGDAQTKINNLPIMQKLPAGVSNAPFGSDKWEADMIKNFAIALVAGILLVFAVLVLLYKRFMSPMVNMGSLLLAPLGGLLALAIVGQPISMPVFIGVLMLFGIVAKNSILLVDFAIEEMDKGASRLEAIIEAGHKRAQPIVMTTVAMTAGMIPTALSLGGDGAWRAPMGTVVIGGLIVSTLLTLLIVPAGFSLADGIEKRLGPWLSKRLLSYETGDDGEGGAPKRESQEPAKGKNIGGMDLGGLQPAE
jgi:multidrug efflux pump subunit AcrB